VACFSIMRKVQPQPGLLVLGDMSVQGNVKPARSLAEPLQVAMDNGAKRALLPVGNKRQVLELAPDVLEHVDPIFYGDVRQAAFKALGLN
jgi:ATP-dependent Lon protease